MGHLAICCAWSPSDYRILRSSPSLLREDGRSQQRNWWRPWKLVEDSKIEVRENWRIIFVENLSFYEKRQWNLRPYCDGKQQIPPDNNYASKYPCETWRICPCLTCQYNVSFNINWRIKSGAGKVPSLWVIFPISRVFWKLENKFSIPEFCGTLDPPLNIESLQLPIPSR